MAHDLIDRLRVSRLLDLYGRLLTIRQQRLLRLYYDDDLSLGEIAQRLRVTRQAVFDVLRRSTEELERLEASLHLVEAHDAATRRRRHLDGRLAALEASLPRLARRLGPDAAVELAARIAAVRRAAR